MNRTLGTALLVLGLAFIAACAVQKPAFSEAQVPAAVRQTLLERFPGAMNPQWSLKADKNYEAEFTAQQLEIAAQFDPDGKWLETETTIPPAAVPQAVQDAAATQFKDCKIIETQLLQRQGAEALTYELHLDTGKEIVKAEFSVSGELLAQSAKPKP